MLFGRDDELRRLAALVDAARQGAGGALVVRGAPGSGKSALLDAAAAAAADDDLTVLRAQGLEAEAPLAFAAVQRLLRPLTPLIPTLPVPQATALRAAFGQETGASPDRFLIFLAVLSLLAESAATRPVLLAVDDAHWLDDASAAALLFAARRIDQEPVAIVFGVRDEESRRFPAADLPQLELSGLDLAATLRVLGETVGREVGPEVGAQLLAATGGNPLALRELPRVLSPDQLAGRTALPGRLPITETLRRVFVEQTERLSAPARELLSLAAADDSGQVATLTAAAARMGIDPAAWDEAERSGMITVADGDVRFRHPLVRSACYAAAPVTARGEAHRALADALGLAGDEDRRAWHLAAGVPGPDPAVAAELRALARRAERRGGQEAAAAAWERAAELSVDPHDRASSLCEAARSAWLAGRIDRARVVADTARRAADTPGLVAAATQVRARIEWNTGSVTAAHRMLLEAARAVADDDPARARWLAMFGAAVATVGGRSAVPIDPRTFSDPRPGDPPAYGRCLRELINGLAEVGDGQLADAVAPLRAALDAGSAAGIDDYDILPNLGVAAMHLGDTATMATVHERMLARARPDGVLTVVLYALTRLLFSDLADGAWSTAAARQTEALTLGAATGQPILSGTPRAGLLLVAALRGDPSYDDHLAELQPTLDRPPTGVLDGLFRDLVRWARATSAFPRTATGFHHLAQLSMDVTRRQAGIDRVEAAVHTGQHDLARAWTADLGRFADVTGHSWAAAISAHGRALLAEDSDADAHFETALSLHAAGARPYDRARTEFAYGEHLRRTRRRVAARDHLRAALHTFQDLKADPWIDRATVELRASGESIRRRQSAAPGELTPQELQVAQLVQRGLSNRDVAAQLFVSPRTVDFHLRNVFTKTGVASRTELAQLPLT